MEVTDKSPFQLPGGEMVHQCVFFNPCRAVVLSFSLLVLGCAGTSRKSAIEPIGEPIKPPPTILELVEKYDENSRNAWIERNVIRIDKDFDDYKASLQRLRTGSNVSSSTVALLSNFLSGLTQSAGVKANYVAVSGIATGFNEIAFKQKFMEQTVSTLISAMEGRRIEAYKRLRIGMLKPVREYGLIDANKDVRAYAWAGHIEEGMGFVVKAAEKEARKAAAQADQEIAEVVSYTEEERQLSFCTSESLDRLSAANTNALKQVFSDLKLDVPNNTDIDGLVYALSIARLNAPPEFQRQVNASMKSKSLLINPCPRY